MRSHRLLMTLSGALLLVSAFTAEARGPWRASEDNTRGWHHDPGGARRTPGARPWLQDA